MHRGTFAKRYGMVVCAVVASLLVAACDGGAADEESGDGAELGQLTPTEESTSEEDSPLEDTDSG